MRLQIITDEMPSNCGDCMLMQYIADEPKCCGLDAEKNAITGNPYSMTYRRSDCPLILEPPKEGE